MPSPFTRPHRAGLAIPVLVAVVALFIWDRLDRSAPGGDELAARPGDEPRLIFDRPWLSKRPASAKERIHALFITEQAPLGAFQRGSAYVVNAELFAYQRDATRLKLVFPQSDRHAEMRYRVHACDEAPPFDLCLDISKNPWGGPRRYYSLRRSRQASDGDAQALEEVMGALVRAARAKLGGSAATDWR
jgi:hypothetical protein